MPGPVTKAAKKVVKKVVDTAKKSNFKLRDITPDFLDKYADMAENEARDLYRTLKAKYNQVGETAKSKYNIPKPAEKVSQVGNTPTGSALQKKANAKKPTSLYAKKLSPLEKRKLAQEKQIFDSYRKKGGNIMKYKTGGMTNPNKKAAVNPKGPKGKMGYGMKMTGLKKMGKKK